MAVTVFDDRDMPLERDLFLRNLVRELAGLLEDVVGYDEAAGYISLVGQNVGNWIDGIYRRALGVQRLSREQTVDALVDFKRRIQGDFYIIEQDDSRIVLGNRACPFEEMVQDRPSMCMMTSNVFGRIIANNLGYARVVLESTIARGCHGCRVSIYLRPGYDAGTAEGREYFGD